MQKQNITKTDKAAIELDLLRAKIKRAEAALEKERAKYILRKDADRHFATLRTNIKRDASEFFRKLAPKLEGLRAQEITSVMDKELPHFIDIIRYANK